MIFGKLGGRQRDVEFWVNVGSRKVCYMPKNTDRLLFVQWENELGRFDDHQCGLDHKIGALQGTNNTLQLRPRFVLDHQSKLTSLLLVPQHPP